MSRRKPTHCKECENPAVYYRLRKVPGMEAYRVICSPACRLRRKNRCKAATKSGKQRCILPAGHGGAHKTGRVGFRFGGFELFHDGERIPEDLRRRWEKAGLLEPGEDIHRAELVWLDKGKKP